MSLLAEREFGADAVTQHAEAPVDAASVASKRQKLSSLKTQLSSLQISSPPLPVVPNLQIPCSAIGGIFAAADLHPTFMFLDDAQRDPEPQADAGDAFGGEEWFEDAGQRFLGIP